MEAKETEEVPLTLEELNLAMDASFMLRYLENRSKKFQDNFDNVFGYVQGWKDRKKYEAGFFRIQRNIEIFAEFEKGLNIKYIAEKYRLSTRHVHRIIKERKDKRGD